MAQQNITIGAAGAGNGDNLYTAFTAVQSNFTELYASSGGGSESVTFENLSGNLGDQTLMGSISLDGFDTQTVYSNNTDVSNAVDGGQDIDRALNDPYILPNGYKIFGTYYDGTAIKAYYQGSTRGSLTQNNSIAVRQDATFPQTNFDFSNAQYPWFYVDWTGIGTALPEATIKIPTSYSTDVPGGDTQFNFEGFATVNISNVKSIVTGNSYGTLKLRGGTNGAGGQTVIKFPDLISLTANLDSAGVVGDGYSLELPKLENISDINFAGDTSLNSYFFQSSSLSELKYIGSLVDSGNLTLTSLTNGIILAAGGITIRNAKDATMTFPKVISLGIQSIIVSDCPNLTLFSIGTTSTLKAISYAFSQNTGAIDFTNCPLLNAAGIADFIITLANVESTYTSWCSGVSFNMTTTGVSTEQDIRNVSAAADAAVTTLQNGGMTFTITP